MGLTTLRKVHPEDGAFVWTNATGSNVAAGDIVAIGKTFGRAFVDIANNATGIVHVLGEVEVPKETGTAYAAGDQVIWSATKAKVVPAGTSGRGWTVVAPALSADATVRVRFTDVPHVYGAKVTVSAGQDSANAVTIDTLLGAVPAGPPEVSIVSTGNVHRKPQGAVAWTLGSVTINDTGLAVNEVVWLQVQVAA